MLSESMSYNPVWIIWVLFTGVCNGVAILQCAQIFWSVPSFNVSHSIQVSEIEGKAKNSLCQNQNQRHCRRKRGRESIFDFDNLEGNSRKRKKTSPLYMECNYRNRRCHSFHDIPTHSTKLKVMCRATSFDDKSNAKTTDSNTYFLPIVAKDTTLPNPKKLPERLKEKLTHKLENVFDEAICSLVTFIVYTTLIHLVRTQFPINIGVTVDIGPLSIAL
uniref:AlNc14C23G2316 protein n=1 Tax=Albugo laibachii Nc14 TaxID=890382 RepID=F0W611_9STRA|nr:AlNc14C23G2316 [Albugo laibachii Nc14]|eukprot:CCA16553.1 AlNc14C23G2316 [Albugo laibachii Nc14]